MIDNLSKLEKKNTNNTIKKTDRRFMLVSLDTIFQQSAISASWKRNTQHTQSRKRNYKVVKEEAQQEILMVYVELHQQGYGLTITKLQPTIRGQMINFNFTLGFYLNNKQHMESHL